MINAKFFTWDLGVRINDIYDLNGTKLAILKEEKDKKALKMLGFINVLYKSKEVRKILLLISSVSS